MARKGVSSKAASLVGAKRNLAKLNEEQVREIPNEPSDFEMDDVEIRSVLRVRRDEISGVWNLNDREILHDIYGELGGHADKLRIISKEILQMLQNYQNSFEKGVVSDYSG